MRHDCHSMQAEPETSSPVKQDAIRRLRESMGWKQKDLERAADVSLSTVQRAERGDPSLKASTLKPIADALRVPLSAIYEVVDAPEREAMTDAPAWAVDMERRIEERARLRHEELMEKLGDIALGLDELDAD